MNYGTAFGFVFDDERWLTKIVIGGLILLIPVIGGIAVYGFILATARNMVEGKPKPLADWNEFGDILTRGFAWLAISLGYTIPFSILIVSVVLGVGTIGAALDSNGSEAASALSMALFLLMVLFVFLAALLVNILLVAAPVRYIQTDNLGEAFNIGAVWRMLLSAPMTLFLVWLVSGLAFLLAALVGMLACGVGVLFTTIYVYGVAGHLTGQLALKLNDVGCTAPLPEYDWIG
jgi:hypothetical protein